MTIKLTLLLKKTIILKKELKKGSYKLSNIVQDSSSNDVIDEYEDIDSKFVRRVENILLSEATSFVALFKSNQNEGSRPGPGMINP
jgi:hypothetical protein